MMFVYKERGLVVKPIGQNRYITYMHSQVYLGETNLSYRASCASCRSKESVTAVLRILESGAHHDRKI
jgi:hypothetical protein